MVAPDESPGSARRHATVLFADLAGFTEMCSQLDPEDVQDTINRCFTLVEEIVVGYGGWVDKYMGDCVMALFGAPKALEDAPRRAINAAIEMRERLPRLVAERKLPRPLEMHVGINTGLVLVASRLKDAATLRQILVGPETWSETKHIFEFRKQEVELKGIAGLFVAHEVLSERPEPAFPR